MINTIVLPVTETRQQGSLTHQRIPNAVLENVLGRLPGMVQRAEGSLLGFCPAHNDHNRSLSFKVGYKGILLKCWAGCPLADICEAIGLKESELFFDAPGSHVYKKNGTVYERANLNFRWPWRKRVGEIMAITTTRRILAEDFLDQVKNNIDANSLTDEQRDIILDQISLAYAWIRVADSAAELCDEIAGRMRREEVGHG